MSVLYGLIGYPLGHSFSEQFFTNKFRQEAIVGVEYRNFPIDNIALFPSLIDDNPSLRGINVTIPYKEQVMKYLTEVDDQARAVGAVNCIKIRGNHLTGYNTDVYGFRIVLSELIGDNRPKALVLGSGGASKAVRYVLEQMGIESTVVSRTAQPHQLTYEQLTPETISSNLLIINTTPLGMYPNIDSSPTLPYGSITQDHFLCDLTYNPTETQFLKRGKERGARVINGELMLIGQAVRSWEIWQS